MSQQRVQFHRTVSTDSRYLLDNENSNAWTEEDVAELRERFKYFLPKYGKLWKQMAPLQEVPKKKKREPLSFLSAIENRETVTIRVDDCCEGCFGDDGCSGCAPPIVETMEQDEAIRPAIDSEAKSSPGSCSIVSTRTSNSANSSAISGSAIKFELSPIWGEQGETNAVIHSNSMDNTDSSELSAVPLRGLTTPTKTPPHKRLGENKREEKYLIVDDDSEEKVGPFQDTDSKDEDRRLEEEDTNGRSSLSSSGSSTVVAARKTPSKRYFSDELAEEEEEVLENGDLKEECESFEEENYSDADSSLSSSGSSTVVAARKTPFKRFLNNGLPADEENLSLGGTILVLTGTRKTSIVSDHGEVKNFGGSYREENSSDNSKIFSSSSSSEGGSDNSTSEMASSSSSSGGSWGFDLNASFGNVAVTNEKTIDADGAFFSKEANQTGSLLVKEAPPKRSASTLLKGILISQSPTTEQQNNMKHPSSEVADESLEKINDIHLMDSRGFQGGEDDSPQGSSIICTDRQSSKGNTQVPLRSKPTRSRTMSSTLYTEPMKDEVTSINSSENEWDENEEESKIVKRKTSLFAKGHANRVVILSDSDDDVSSNDEWQESYDSDGSDIEESCQSSIATDDTIDRNREAMRRPTASSITKKGISLKKSTFTIPRKDKNLSKAAFRRSRGELTTKVFSEFNEQAFQKALANVVVTWSQHLRTTAGLTRLKKVTPKGCPPQRTATIELSVKIIDELQRLRATLLHEMCHAAAWLVDGKAKPPHGACFKKWAKLSMSRIRDVMVTTTHDYEITYKYAWACTSPDCGTIIKRHSRSVDVNHQCCGKCKGKLIEIEVPLASGSTNFQHTPKKKKALSGFNLFVQQQSKTVREKLVAERKQNCSTTTVTQAEVMKECARMWREQKQP